MNKINSKKIMSMVAIFMVILIINIPIALAQTLSVNTISGTDGEDGFARRFDTLTVDVTANVPPADTNAYVWIYWDDDSYSAVPCSATAQPGEWSCKLLKAIYGASSDTYKIVLFNPNFLWETGSAYKTLQKPVTIDNSAPYIKSISAAVPGGSSITAGPVEITFTAQDYSESGIDTDLCVGLKEVRFYDQTASGTELAEDYTMMFGKTPNRICKPGQKKFTYVAEEQGSHVICAEAEDWFGQKSSKKCISSPFTVSNVPPSFAESPMKINGKSQTFIRTPFSAFSATIDITLVSSQTINKVVADFSGITTQTASRTQTQLRSKQGDNQTFRFSDIYANKLPGSSCAVNIEATDSVGNKLTESIPCGFDVDNEGPVFSEIYTETSTGIKLEPEDGKPFIGRNVNLHIVFDEPKSGMSQKKAYLNLQELGLGSKVQATNCGIVAGGLWDCYWFLTPSPNKVGNYSIKVQADTQDDLGNKISSETGAAKPVYAETAVPLITDKSISWKKIGAYTQVPDYFVKDDTVRFTFNITNAFKIVADLSGVAGAAKAQVPILCASGYCTYDERVAISGPKTATLKFDIFTKGGTTETRTSTLQIYGVLNETNPNYWESSVECSPIVDRLSSTYINERVSCVVTLTPNADDVDTASISFDGLAKCNATSPGGKATDYANSIRIMNTQEESRSPILSVSLLKREFAINELDLSCPLTIYSKKGSSVFENYETENVNIPIKFFNLPLGNLQAQYNHRIKSAVQNANLLNSRISALDKIFSTASRICSIKTTITNILGGLEGVIAVLSVWPGGQSPASAICGGAKAKLESIYSFKLFNYIDKMCSYVNCAASDPSPNSLGFDSYWGAGGGAPWCQSWMKFFESGNVPIDAVNLKAQGATGESLTIGAMNVKDSLLLSASCLCLPGVIYNLKKYNQIQCRYALCLYNDVRNEGIPVSSCTLDRKREICQYVKGELFELIPFASLVSNFLNIIKQAYANPFVLLAMVSGCICGGCSIPFIPGANIKGVDLCPADKVYLHPVCDAILIIKKIGDAWASTKSIKDSNWYKGPEGDADACAQMKKQVKLT